MEYNVLRRKSRGKTARLPDGMGHFNSEGRAVMADVTDKEPTCRTAVAKGKIKVNGEAFRAIKEGTAARDDVLGVATVAGIMAAKRTWEIIPMCHNIPLTECGITFGVDEERLEVECSCSVKTVGKTGAGAVLPAPAAPAR